MNPQVKQLLTVTFALLTAWGANANSIVNGDFETPVQTTIWTYSAGQTFDGWTVATGSVDQTSDAFFAAASGRQSMDLSGLGAGSIYQDLSTTIGQPYRLSFAFAGNPGGNPIKHLQLFWGGQLIDSPTFDDTGRTFTDMGWTTLSYDLSATGSTTRLQFTSLDDSAAGPAIDNVVLTAVPEPAALAILALGATLVLVRRKGAHARRSRV